MSLIDNIGHVVLNVSDVERSLAFYRDVVGFEVARHIPGRNAFLTCGVVHHNLAIFKAPEDAQPLQKGDIGLHHFAFELKTYQELQAAYKRLQQAETPIEEIVDHGLSRSIFFLDPDGIVMELFCDAFATEEEGLAYMKATTGLFDPLDINGPEPPAPEIPSVKSPA